MRTCSTQNVQADNKPQVHWQDLPFPEGWGLQMWESPGIPLQLRPKRGSKGIGLR